MDDYFACKFLTDNDIKRFFNVKRGSGVETWETITGTASFWGARQPFAWPFSGRVGSSSAGSE